jgi:hypothetical protein
MGCGLGPKKSFTQRIISSGAGGRPASALALRHLTGLDPYFPRFIPRHLGGAPKTAMIELPPM